MNIGKLYEKYKSIRIKYQKDVEHGHKGDTSITD